LDVGDTPGAEQHLVRNHVAVFAADLIRHLLFSAAARHAADSRSQLHLDTVACHARLKHLRGLRFLLREEVQADDRHLGAEAPKPLSQLATYGPGAQYHQALRQLGEPEDVLVGQIVDVREPGNGQPRRACPASDHGTRELEAAAIDLDDIAAYEAA